MSLDDPAPDLTTVEAVRLGDRLQIGAAETLDVTDLGAGRLALSAPRRTGLAGALAAFEALTAEGSETVIVLEDAGWEPLAADLERRGVAARAAGRLMVLPALFWQVPDRWLCHPAPAWPTLWLPGPHGRHPLRPPKPSGALYRRRIPWLGRVLSLRAACLDDLPTFHRWQNDPRVAAFFDEAGTLEQHRAYLQRLIDDPHMLPVIGALDGRDFAYFELYWTRENRLGAQYEAGPWDRGWHVLVGEADLRGADHVTAWLPSLMHYMFLAEPRTQAVMGEPRASHQRQLTNLARGGFARLRDFDFPHKRATLVRLERQHFFEARLWARPPDGQGDPSPLAPARLLAAEGGR